MVADKPEQALVVRAPSAMQLVRPVATPDQLVEAHAEITQLIVRALKPGQDYGVIPGTGGGDKGREKNVLLKPGAERLAIAFGCRPEYEVVEQEIDHDRVNTFATPWVESDEKPNKQAADELKRKKLGRWKKKPDGEFVWMVRGDGESSSRGLYRFVIRCRLVRQDGLHVGDGIGSCSTLESKYIDRPRDCENTVLKMAQKRALVAAVLNAFGLSDRFTQDVEEEHDVLDAVAVAVETKKPPPPRSAPVQGASAIIRGYCDALDQVEQLQDIATLQGEWGDRLERLPPRSQRVLEAYERQVSCRLTGEAFTASDEEEAALEALRGVREGA